MRMTLVNYSHALPRPLDAEVLLDAISDVTGVAETFSTVLPDAGGSGGRAPAGTRAIQLKETDIYYSPFLDIYGRPNRFSVPERNAKPNLSQALHILAGTTYHDKLLAKRRTHRRVAHARRVRQRSCRRTLPGCLLPAANA